MRRLNFSEKVSLVALCLSALTMVFTYYTFYYQNLRTKNIVIVKAPIVRYVNNGAFEFELVIYNPGTSKQSILGLTPYIYSVRDNLRSKVELYDPIEPFTIGVGGIEFKKLRFQLPSSYKENGKCSLSKPAAGNFHLYLGLISTDVSSKETEINLRLGKASVNDWFFNFTSESIATKIESGENSSVKNIKNINHRAGMNMAFITGVEDRVNSWVTLKPNEVFSVVNGVGRDYSHCKSINSALR